MGKDMHQILGAIYIEGKKILDVKEMDAHIESVTYDPEQRHATVEWFSSLGLAKEIQMTFTFDRPWFDKRIYNRLMGWKNYDKPRKRMRSRAAKLRYKHTFFITAKRLERMLRRHNEQARRRWLKTGYDPVWHYTEAPDPTRLPDPQKRGVCL